MNEAAKNDQCHLEFFVTGIYSSPPLFDDMISGAIICQQRSCVTYFSPNSTTTIVAFSSHFLCRSEVITENCNNLSSIIIPLDIDTYTIILCIYNFRYDNLHGIVLVFVHRRCLKATELAEIKQDICVRSKSSCKRCN